MYIIMPKLTTRVTYGFSFRQLRQANEKRPLNKFKNIEQLTATILLFYIERRYNR